jgi:TolA-binding protein
MRQAIVLVLILAMCAGLTGVVWAQDRADKASQVEQSKLFLQWLKMAAGKLDQELLQARREQNAKKINCIEDRLDSLKELINETGGLYQQLRALAMQQRVDEANKVFAKLNQNKDVAEQIMKLIDDCFQNINVEGGFVETLQEWLGDPTAGDPTLDDPTASEPRSGAPEPVPDEFTPGPVSEEDEES